uniref:Uncharacterized protein n=1 Tax=Bionectria ochroleuca TaxID=29856 RepID=A0A0B7K1A6_BIOOC
MTSSKPDLQMIRTIFEDDDILLGCIRTVSSRYYHLPKSAIGGFERSCEIHSRCWDWVKKEISKVIFEGSRPKAMLSVIESLLMLAEWMPRSIHASVDIPDQRHRGLTLGMHFCSYAHSHKTNVIVLLSRAQIDTQSRYSVASSCVNH